MMETATRPSRIDQSHDRVDIEKREIVMEFEGKQALITTASRRHSTFAY